MAFKRSAVRSRLSPPGRLAQLVAHPLDVREVTSSSLVSSTKEKPRKSVVFRVLCHYFTRWPRGTDHLRKAAGKWLRLKAPESLWSGAASIFLLLQALLQAIIGPPWELLGGPFLLFEFGKDLFQRWLRTGVRIGHRSSAGRFILVVIDGILCVCYLLLEP